MKTKAQILEACEKLEEMLDDSLADTDPQHREEVLDIARLLSRRTEMYLENYGIKTED